MAYVEHSLGVAFLDKESDVARATLVVDRLRSAALCPAHSVALIRRILDELD